MLESMAMASVKILLASNSPRRRQLLSWTGWDFEASPVNIDETPYSGERPDAYVLRLAETKARRAASLAEPGMLVLAADTTVADGDLILGKPADRAEAADMLSRLRGRTHYVYTALVILDPENQRLEKDLCASEVPMRTYSDAEIEAYIASGDPFDKAGAYAIQNREFHPVINFDGCFANVMGLPLCHLVRTMRKLGLESEMNVPITCQVNLSYNCPVFQAILERKV